MKSTHSVITPLVESVRIGDKVRQQTLINLGRHFDVPREQWASLTQRIEKIIQGDLFPSQLAPHLEELAQNYAASVINARSRQPESSGTPPDYQTVVLQAWRLLRPRSVGVEHVALRAAEQAGLDTKLKALGFNRVQCQAAIATIIARMVNPGSELATHQWLQQSSGLDELMGCDFDKMSLMQLYRVSDKLYTNKNRLESFLYQQERDLFKFDEVITLYDLTNTYFEGSGFVKKSEIFPGNASELETLGKMIGKLSSKENKQPPVVVLDAGIATQENITWLIDNGYRYIVVSRKRERQFDEAKAHVIKETADSKISVQRIVCQDSDEIELYCHSQQREKKETGINELFAQRFEGALEKLASGLHKKRAIKKYDRIIERIGRLKQKYSRAARYYEISVDQQDGTATAIHWKRTKTIKETLPGVYCLRTNQTQWDAAALWQTYTMLTDLEAVFRSLKSELGLRPVFHHKTDRVSGHLFISVLAYHLVHTLRFQLKAQDIHLSWDGLRKQLTGQDRVTVQLKREDGKTLHVRKTTRAEQRQQIICDVLGIEATPGRIERTVID